MSKEETPTVRDESSLEAGLHVGLSLMQEEAFFHATRPLFEENLVEVVEWSFDMGWGQQSPEWLSKLLLEYSKRNHLLGHGVSYSPLDASCTPRQEVWLHHLREELCKYRYRHLSEHFAFMGGGNFHIGAPLPVPLTDEAVAIGQNRLVELKAASGLDIGLENLGFAFSPEDVANQGEFLRRMLEPVDGFLLLDLHNLYCQLCNFDVTPEELLESYPLERVKEIHVSGGSWSEGQSGAVIRRDTHDESVPDEVFRLVSLAIPRCPNLEFVIFERLGNTIQPDDYDQLREDFHRLRACVRHAT